MEELAGGGRVVVFDYCISLVVFTLRRESRPHLLAAGQWGVLRGLPYVALSLTLGWWGIPWGVVLTPITILTNLWGGRDVTAEVRQRLEAEEAEQ